MSFFDDTENFGLMVTIAGIVTIICALLSIVLVFTYSPYDYWWWGFSTNYKVGFAITGIGTMASGLLVLLYGLNVRGQGDKLSFLANISSRFASVPSNDKPGLLSGFLYVVGIAGIVGGIFTAIGQSIMGLAGSGIGVAIIAIIVGLFYIWAAPQVRGEDKGFDRKLLWIILLVLTILALVGDILGIFAFAWIWTAVLAIASLCMLLVDIFILLFLVSDEVKEKMGV